MHSWYHCEGLYPPRTIKFPSSPSSTPQCTPRQKISSKGARHHLGLKPSETRQSIPSDFHTFLWPLEEIHSPGYLIKCLLAPICASTVPKLSQLAAVSTGSVLMVHTKGIFTLVPLRPFGCCYIYSEYYLLLLTKGNRALPSLLVEVRLVVSFVLCFVVPSSSKDFTRSGLQSQLFPCL